MSKYYNITDAWNDVKKSEGIAGTTFSVGKLVGKSTLNTTIFAVTELLPSFLDKSEEHFEKQSTNKDLTEEERIRYAEKAQKLADSKESRDNLRNIRK